MNWLGFMVQNLVLPEETVLDCGCGIMQAMDDLKCKSILGCDIWPTYLSRISKLHPTVRITMSELDRFVDNSYDVVLCLDVLEHLDQELALKVLEEMKRICRKKAIVFTPRKFDSNMESVTNAWDLGECPYQEHKCVIGEPTLNGFGYKITDINGEALFGVYSK